MIVVVVVLAFAVIFALVKVAPVYNETVTFDPCADGVRCRWECWKCGAEGIDTIDAIHSAGFNHTPACPARTR